MNLHASAHITNCSRTCVSPVFVANEPYSTNTSRQPPIGCN